MEQPFIYATECVICLKEIENNKWNSFHQENDNNRPDLFLEQSFLKLLQLDNGAISISNSRNSVDHNYDDSVLILFCRNCCERNVEIHNLFDQIEALGKSLEGLKNSIEDQVRESETILRERKQKPLEKHQIKSEAAGRLKTSLRCELSKHIGILSSISTDDYNNTMEYEDTNGDDIWEDSGNEYSVVSIPEVIADPEDHEQAISNLKTLHKIKELSVSVQRLPGFIIPTAKFNVGSLPNNLTGKNEIRARSILCLIPGCKANKEFRSEKARKQHMIAAHDFTVPSKKSSMKHQDFLKEAVRYNCIYNDCKSSFNSKFGRYQHLRKCHGDSDFRQRLQEENARGSSSSLKNSSSSLQNSALSLQNKETPDDKEARGPPEIPNVQESKQNENSEEPNEVLVPIRCLIPGCKANKEFLTEKARKQHMIAAHDFTSHKKSSKKNQGTKAAVKYNCIYNDCESSFNSKFGRYQHLRKFHGDSDFRQRLQEENARGFLSSVQNGGEIPAEGDGEHENPDCQQSQQNRNPQAANLLKHPILCRVAGCKTKKVFRTEKARNLHMVAAHNFVSLSKNSTETNQEPKLSCIYPDCKSTFNNKLARYQHLRKRHSNRDFLKRLQEAKRLTEPTTFPCVFPNCETFDNEKSRLEHMKTSHPEHQMKRKYRKRKPKVEQPKKYVIKKPFCCDVPDCKRRQGFYTQADLDLHKRVVHEGQRQSYACKDCGKCFSKPNLWAHYQAVHLKIRKFMCHICGYATTSGRNLKAHLPKHTDERNYKCDLCQKGFKTREGKVIHIRYAHTGERPYRCDRCGKGFVTGSQLSKHINSVHNPHIRPHICEICGKAFPIHQYLHNHMVNSHRDAPPRRRIKKPKVPAASATTGGNQAVRSETLNNFPEAQNIRQQEAGIPINEPANSWNSSLAILANLSSSVHSQSASHVPVNLSNDERFAIKPETLAMNFPVFNPGPFNF